MYLIPGSGLHSREFLILAEIVLGVHLLDFVTTRSAKDLEDLEELIDLGIPQKGSLSVDHLHQNAAGGPHIDLGGVLGGPENQLGSSVAPRTNIGDVGLSPHQLLGRPEVADNHCVLVFVDQDILGLDVAVGNGEHAEVIEAADNLIGVELDKERS